MIKKDKRTIELNNPSFEVVIKYSHPTIGTAYSSELMDKLSKELQTTAEEVITDYLKKKFKREERIVLIPDENIPF